MNHTCKITFRKQLLPRFFSPATEHKFSEESLLLDDLHSKGNPVISFFHPIIKPATPIPTPKIPATRTGDRQNITSLKGNQV